MAYKKPKKPKLGAMPKSKNPAIVARAISKKIDKVKDYEAKVKSFESDVKKVEKLKDDFQKLKNRLSK